MRCVMGAKFNMKATVLNRAEAVPAISNVEEALVGGHFETVQDPDTGAITRVWVEDTAPVVTDPRPGTTHHVNVERFDIECYARGFTELGFRSTANTQTFDDGLYRAVEVIQMNFPAKYVLNRNQFVTNIRDRMGNVLWLEEEIGQPTVFDVQGVTPIFDAFNRHRENIAVLRRAANQ